jgi:plastocyanin domain-containing protein
MRAITLFALFSLCLLPLTGEARPIRPARPRTQEVTITLTDKGYQPLKVQLRRGIPARLTFIRKVEVTCATEVVIESYNISRKLPLNEPVVIEFTPVKAGELTYTCSMKMVGGSISIK